MSQTCLPSTDRGTKIVAPSAVSCGQARQWELVEFAGCGSLACVYRSRLLGSPIDQPAPYALKILHEARQNDPEAIRFLRREALVGRLVANPHLISVLTSFVSDEPRMLVMPWLEGASLRARLTLGEPLAAPASKILWIVRQSAEALSALHDAGWMHGDVTPENIHLSPVGHVTLLDLSFARRRDEIGSAADRPIHGKCNYIAPEFFTSALRPDIRSDIYSLGVVMFEMFSGRLPYFGRTLEELAVAYRQSKPADLRKLAPHIPNEIVGLVKRMIAHEPFRRPDPSELIERLIELEISSFSQWN